MYHRHMTTYAPIIKKIRKERGFSQTSLAEKLGMSRSSYVAVENGSKGLTLDEAQKVSTLLGLDMEAFSNTEHPNYEKYKEMILAFLRMNKHVTKTKLAKLLYLADFGWFYTHLQSMSGMQYRKIQYGPVADPYFRIIDEMSDAGEIAIEQTDEGAMRISQTRGSAKVVLAALTSEEKQFMEKVDNKWKGKKTADIVAFTHKQLPYLFAEDNEIVSYDVFTQENPEDIF